VRIRLNLIIHFTKKNIRGRERERESGSRGEKRRLRAKVKQGLGFLKTIGKGGDSFSLIKS